MKDERDLNTLLSFFTAGFVMAKTGDIQAAQKIGQQIFYERNGYHAGDGWYYDVLSDFCKSVSKQFRNDDSSACVWHWQQDPRDLVQ